MTSGQLRDGTGKRARAAAMLAVLAALVLTPDGAAAHFYLEGPESWREQGALGDPQKTGPCGDEGAAAETGAVTAFRAGDTVTITFRETIFHPGHFRVALAVTDRGELPAVPPVTPGATDCGSVPIMDPPVFPVLADGVLAHTSPLTGVQTIEVTLPADVTCDHCTLQVVQFMSNHGAPCFYYHCADISVASVVVDSGAPPADAATEQADAAGTEPVDAATMTAMDAGAARVDAGRAPPAGGGCGCMAPRRGASVGTVLALGALALAMRRARRRRA